MNPSQSIPVQPPYVWNGVKGHYELCDCGPCREKMFKEREIKHPFEQYYGNGAWVARKLKHGSCPEFYISTEGGRDSAWRNMWRVTQCPFCGERA